MMCPTWTYAFHKAVGQVEMPAVIWKREASVDQLFINY